MNLKKDSSGGNIKNNVIVILGPTASGKTELAAELAKKIKGEIISADSMQVYKHMNIGTAKPSVALRKTVPHHLVSILDPDMGFSAGEFKRRAERKIRRVLNKKKVPVVTGGTGLYIRTLTDGLCESPPEDKKLRKKLGLTAKKQGKQYLYNRLAKIDPVTAGKTHKNNLVRVVRALEVYELTGIPFSEWHGKMAKPIFRFSMFGILWEREELYSRINDRVDAMFSKGFINEVKRLMKMGYKPGLRSMQSIGYSHIVEHLENKYDFATLVEHVKMDTRRYAKRQLTWWKKDKRIKWIKAKPADRGYCKTALMSECRKVL